MAKQKDSSNPYFKMMLMYLLFIGIMIGAIAFLLPKVDENTIKDIRKALNPPNTDTTITIHNGVPDTVITIRK